MLPKDVSKKKKPSPTRLPLLAIVIAIVIAFRSRPIVRSIVLLSIKETSLPLCRRSLTIARNVAYVSVSALLLERGCPALITIVLLARPPKEAVQIFLKGSVGGINYKIIFILCHNYVKMGVIIILIKETI